MTLRELLRTRRLVIVLGTGGVGKTTLAASAALDAARGGRRVALLTIDPARRLAQALGVDALDDTPTPVEIGDDARLDALMLAPERTFDRLVERFAHSEVASRRVLDNPIYRHLSRTLAGSAEYAAMERVHELLSDGAYDTIVVDTPPSQHALDFLEAPQRLLGLFDSNVLRRLVHPAFAAGRFGMQWFQRATTRVLKTVERVTGVGFLEELSEFLLAFEAMSGAFRIHAGEVREALGSAAFVLVAAPTRDSARNAERFWERLEDADARPAGVVWNRMHPLVADRVELPTVAALAAWLRAAGTIDDAERNAETALHAARRYASWAESESRATAALSNRAVASGGFVRRVPELSVEIHDLEGLSRLASELCGVGHGDTGDA